MNKTLLALALLGGTAFLPATASAGFSLGIAQPGFNLVVSDFWQPAYYPPSVEYAPPPPVYYVPRPVYYAPAPVVRYEGRRGCWRHGERERHWDHGDDD